MTKRLESSCLSQSPLTQVSKSIKIFLFEKQYLPTCRGEASAEIGYTAEEQLTWNVKVIAVEVARVVYTGLTTLTKQA